MMKSPQNESNSCSLIHVPFARPVLSAAILLCLIPSSVVVGQDRSSLAQTARPRAVPLGLPDELLRHVDAVGERLRRPDKDETVLHARLVGLGDTRPVQVVYQLSGVVAITGVNRGLPLTFDGQLSRGLSNSMDQALLDTFVVDTVEGLMYAARHGAAVRLVGRNFRPDPRVEPHYSGPHYDIYEVLAAVRSHQGRPLQLKRYYFDSNTGLLSSTRYSDASRSPALEVETRFSDWQKLEGSAFPGKIERYENDTPVFSLIVTAASARAGHKDASVR
jgi:hypothetical protein